MKKLELVHSIGDIFNLVDSAPTWSKEFKEKASKTGITAEAVTRVSIDPIDVTISGTVSMSIAAGLRDAVSVSASILPDDLSNLSTELNKVSEITGVKAILTSDKKRIILEGRTYSYILSKGKNNIKITQNDVRAVQLAKAALYAGCQLVMDKINVPRVDKILLAGAFGAYIDPKYALILGMLPDCELSKIKSVGNAAGTGARIALLDQKSRIKVENLVQKIKKIETAVEPNFQNYFVEAMAIPHKTAPYNELRKAVSLPTTETTFGTTHSEFKRRRQRKHRKD